MRSGGVSAAASIYQIRASGRDLAQIDSLAARTIGYTVPKEVGRYLFPVSHAYANSPDSPRKGNLVPVMLLISCDK